MDDSIAQPGLRSASFEVAGWKNLVSVISAVLMAALFLLAGVWKISDPFGAAERFIQLQVPGEIAVPSAVALGIVETFAGVLLLVPRFRRWGAWVTGLLLVVFMIYVGVQYETLRGEECSCFPWMKRAVGPGFFIGDAVMLLLAVLAGIWARPSDSKRSAAIVLGAVTVFGLTSFGIAYTRQTGTVAPASIQLDGKPYSLATGRNFIYFFDPECSHCLRAAKDLATYQWKNVKIIGVATAQPQFAAYFLKDTGLKATLSSDVELLRKTFPFGDAPFAVAVENGRSKQSFLQFEGDQPKATLKSMGWVE